MPHPTSGCQQGADCRFPATAEVTGVPLQYYSSGQAPPASTQHPQQYGYGAPPPTLTADEAFLLQQSQQGQQPAAPKPGVAQSVVGAPRRLVNLVVSSPFRALSAAHRAVLPGTEEGRALGERRVAKLEARQARREGRTAGRVRRYDRLTGVAHGDGERAPGTGASGEGA